MKKKKNILIKYMILLGLILFVGIHERSFLKEAWTGITLLPRKKIFLIVCLSLGYQFLEGAVIWLMMQKYVPVYRYGRGVRCAFVSSFFRFATLGSGGMAAEIVELSKDGADAARAGGMSMVQYLLHKITITVYGIIAFFLLMAFSEGDVKAYGGFLWIGTVLTAAIALFLIFLCTSVRFSDFCFWAAKMICRGKWQDKMDYFREKTAILQAESKSLLQKAGRLWKIVLLDFGKLTCWYLVPFVALYGNVTAAAWELIALTAVAQMLAGVIPAPAGIGSLEFVFLLLSARVVGESEALLAILLLRAAINLIPFVPGLILSVADKRRGNS